MAKDLDRINEYDEYNAIITINENAIIETYLAKDLLNLGDIEERKKEQDKFTSQVTESIRGIREIKTLGIKNSLLNDMAEIIKVIFQKSKNEIDKIINK